MNKLISKALSKQRQKHYLEARNLYLKLLKKEPFHLDANYLLGTLYAETGDLIQAERYLQSAVQIDPNSAWIQTNLGTLYKLQGKYEAAEACYRKALHLMPGLAEANFALGLLLYKKSDRAALEHLLQAERANPHLAELQKGIGLACLHFGHTTEAIHRLSLAHNENPHDVESEYFLSVAEGRQPSPTLQQQYVQHEFDHAASSFEDKLAQVLGYDVPNKARVVLHAHLGDSFTVKNAVDLGCGTGLSGTALADHVEHLTGIDISAKMVAQAKQKSCYTTLLEGDIIACLEASNCRFGLFVALDTVIYIGGLEDLIQAVITTATSEGYFIFSTENCDQPGVVLQHSGRYAHSVDYIQALAASHNCRVLEAKEVFIRHEGGAAIMGHIYLFKLPSSLNELESGPFVP